MFRFVALGVVGRGELLHVGETLAVVVVVGAEVVFVVELSRVAFIADCAVEEADGRWKGVVSLRGVLVMRG